MFISFHQAPGANHLLKHSHKRCSRTLALPSLFGNQLIQILKQMLQGSMETGSRTSTPRPSFQFDQFSHFHGTHTNHVIARLSYSPLPSDAPLGSNGTEDLCVSNCDYAFALGERLLNMPPRVSLDDLLYGNAVIRRLAVS